MKGKFNGSMKKNLTLSACALAMLAATSMPALAESVELAVKGTIIPAACTPSITGEINYGNVTAEQLSATDYTVLDKKEVDFAINCDAPVKVAIKAINGQPGTVAGGSSVVTDGSQKSPVDLLGMATPQIVGLGVDEGDKNIGGYAVGLVASGLSADGQGLTVKINHDGTGRDWGITSGDIVSLFVNTVTHSIYSWSASPGANPGAIKDLTGKLAVQAYLNNTDELKVDKAIQLNGLTTIELVYL